MGATMRTGGLTTDDIGAYGNRLAFTLPNGDALVVLRDPNTAGAIGGDGTGVEKCYIYTSVDRVAWTLRATITLPAATYRMCAALHSNGDLSIFHESNPTTTIRHCVLTNGTWAVSAWEVAATATGAFHQMDAHVTDDGWIVLSALQLNNTQLNVLTRIKVSGSWATVTTQTSVTNGQRREAMETVTVTSGTVSGVKKLYLAVGQSGPSDTAYDDGIRVFTYNLNATTGALTSSSENLRFAENTISKSTVRRQSRIAKFFRHDGDIYLGVMHAEGNRLSYALRFSQATGTLTLVGSISTSIFAPSHYTIHNQGMGIGFANGTLNFMSLVNVNASYFVNSQTAHYVAGGTNPGFVWSATGFSFLRNYPANLSGVPYEGVYLASGGDRNTSLGKLEMLALLVDLATTPDTYKWYHQSNTVPGTTSAVNPSGNTVVSTSRPTVSATYAETTSFQSPVTIQVQMAKDSAFTTNLIDFTGSSYILASPKSPTGANVSTVIAQATPELYSVTAGLTVWYIRVRTVDIFGGVGSWSTVETFYVQHPPTLTPSDPVDKNFNFGTGNILFKWNFADAWTSDWQTAHRLEIIRTDTSAVIYDSTKTANLNHQATVTLLAAHKTLPLAWRIQGWDSADMVGPWSQYAPFVILDGPTVTITAPAQDATVVSPNPTITFSATTYTAVPIVSYSVSVFKDGIEVWSTGTKPAEPSASGTTWNEVMTGNHLRNGQTYSLRIAVTDQWGLTTITPYRNFTAAWTPPAVPSAITVSTVAYNVEDFGYTLVTWTNANKDAQFTYYAVERKDDMIDPDTSVVLEEGQWVEVYRTYEDIASYEFHDYYAPSQYRVNYRISQVVTRFSDLVPSDPTASVASFPVSDGYWLIDPSLGLDDKAAFKLHNVVDDSYTDIYEEEEYIVIGRGYHLDQGDRIGYNGSMTAQLRNSGGTSARYKKKRLEQIKQEARDLYVRNPFGDVFKVGVKSMTFARIPGVGRAEFVDVTIPYLEVSE